MEGSLELPGENMPLLSLERGFERRKSRRATRATARRPRVPVDELPFTELRDVGS